MSHRSGLSLSLISSFLMIIRFMLADMQPHFQNICKSLEPEVFMSAKDIITNRGYNVQAYTVQTQDGYLLEMLRMNGDSSKKNDSKQPVYLQHGMGGSAFDFVANFGNQSLGYLLTDEGYDVWLGNFRGNAYSRRHNSLDPDNDKEFWNYSWDELAAYDLPAMIDFVLNETGYNELLYIGHSMGTTAMFALLSSKPQYNTKIKLFVALAPVATTGHLKTPYVMLLPFLNLLETALNIAGIYEVKPVHARDFTLSMCTVSMTMLYENLFFLYGGFDSTQWNTTRLPVYVANFPKGLSLNTFYHYAQMIKGQKFQFYDFGQFINQQKYGQADPPEYDLNNVSSLVALIWGSNDFLADPEDVKILSESLPNLFAFYRIDFDSWSHFDFIYGMDADKLQNDYIGSLLKSV